MRFDPTFSAIWRHRARARSLNGSFELLGNERFGSLAAAAINQKISDTIAAAFLAERTALATRSYARADHADSARNVPKRGNKRGDARNSFYARDRRNALL